MEFTLKLNIDVYGKNTTYDIIKQLGINDTTNLNEKIQLAIRQDSTEKLKNMDTSNLFTNRLELTFATSNFHFENKEIEILFNYAFYKTISNIITLTLTIYTDNHKDKLSYSNNTICLNFSLIEIITTFINNKINYHEDKIKELKENYNACDDEEDTEFDYRIKNHEEYINILKGEEI